MESLCFLCLYDSFSTNSLSTTNYASQFELTASVGLRTALLHLHLTSRISYRP